MDPIQPDGTPGRVLRHLKRTPGSGIPELARSFEMSPESVRAHVKRLETEGLISVVGTRSEGRGRPERLYSLTLKAESLFPRREAEILRGLASYLAEKGEEDVLSGFLQHFAAERQARAATRLQGLSGRPRLDEVASILTEEGYMAEIHVPGGDEAPRLRLCHCPLRELVEVTRTPCAAEIGFVQSLVGGTLARVEYIPDGDAACTYAVGGGGAS